MSQGFIGHNPVSGFPASQYAQYRSSALPRLETNYAAKSKFHVFIVFPACDRQGEEFA